MLGKLILAFVLVPLADLFLLMVLSDYTGWQVTVAIVILSGILGAYLAKRSSQAVGVKIRERMLQGQMSPDLLTDGAMIFFAAGLLLTPGFITDVVGLSLLIPVCRRWYKARITNWFKRNIKVQVVQMPPEFDSNTVDGEVVGSAEAGPGDSGTTGEHAGPKAIESGELLP